MPINPWSLAASRPSGQRPRPVTTPLPKWPAPASVGGLVAGPVADAAKRMQDAAVGLSAAPAYDPIIALPDYAGIGTGDGRPWSQTRMQLLDAIGKLSVGATSPEEIAAKSDAELATTLAELQAKTPHPANPLLDYQEPEQVALPTRVAPPAPTSRSVGGASILAAALMGLVSPEATGAVMQQVVSARDAEAARQDDASLRQWSSKMQADEAEYNDRIRRRAENIAADLRKRTLQSQDAEDKYQQALKAGELGARASNATKRADALHTATRTVNQVRAMQGFLQVNDQDVEARKKAMADKAKADVDAANLAMQAAEAISRQQYQNAQIDNMNKGAERAEIEADRMNAYRNAELRIRQVDSARDGIRLGLAQDAAHRAAKGTAGSSPSSLAREIAAMKPLLDEGADVLRTLNSERAGQAILWPGNPAMKRDFDQRYGSALASYQETRRIYATLVERQLTDQGFPVHVNKDGTLTLGAKVAPSRRGGK